MTEEYVPEKTLRELVLLAVDRTLDELGNIGALVRPCERPKKSETEYVEEYRGVPTRYDIDLHGRRAITVVGQMVHDNEGKAYLFRIGHPLPDVQLLLDGGEEIVEYTEHELTTAVPEDLE